MPHWPDAGTEAQRSRGTCPRSRGCEERSRDRERTCLKQSARLTVCSTVCVSSWSFFLGLFRFCPQPGSQGKFVINVRPRHTLLLVPEARVCQDLDGGWRQHFVSRFHPHGPGCRWQGFRTSGPFSITPPRTHPLVSSAAPLGLGRGTQSHRLAELGHHGLPWVREEPAKVPHGPASGAARRADSAVKSSLSHSLSVVSYVTKSLL